ncbi:MAG: MltA domain-containing protein, partial [Deltaproteobacteria bacterium]|nr:MltA domain-containing protein [Deltaproteobacteria bacterium]
ILKQSSDSQQFNKDLREKFYLYKAAGFWGSKKVLFTGYFEPIFDGSLESDSVYKYPLYRRPDNLLTIHLGLFRSKLSGQRIMARIQGNSLVKRFPRCSHITNSGFRHDKITQRRDNQGWI